MLAGLLLYDVFWVFGSKSVIGDNVMLTVATSDIISGPTRLLFPRLEGKPMGEAADFPFSLLGEPFIEVIISVVIVIWIIMVLLIMQMLALLSVGLLQNCCHINSIAQVWETLQCPSFWPV